MNEYVYFLTNRAMPGLIKIGHTTIPLTERLAQLNSTGVPVPFEIGANFLVNNAKICEASIHKTLTKYRLSKNREFFKLSLKKAVTKSFEIIQSHLVDTNKESVLGVVTTQGLNLSEIEISLLKFLCGRWKDRGYETGQIQ